MYKINVQVKKVGRYNSMQCSVTAQYTQATKCMKKTCTTNSYNRCMSNFKIYYKICILYYLLIISISWSLYIRFTRVSKPYIFFKILFFAWCLNPMFFNFLKLQFKFQNIRCNTTTLFEKLVVTSLRMKETEDGWN